MDDRGQISRTGSAGPSLFARHPSSSVGGRGAANFGRTNPSKTTGRGSGNVSASNEETTSERVPFRVGARMKETADMADDPVTRSEITAHLGAVEARTDAKFAQLLGKIDVSAAELKGEIGKVATRLDGVERSTTGVKTTIVVTAVAVVAVIVGILSFGQQWFGIGLSTRDIVHATVTELHQQEVAPQNPQKK
jgi:hypothetical protein